MTFGNSKLIPTYSPNDYLLDDFDNSELMLNILTYGLLNTLMILKWLLL
jgi:hypothetical protein